MKAYTEGKQIEFTKYGENKWGEVENPWWEPKWDWYNFEYRVKPESTYRQYKNIKEMLEDINKRLVAIQNPPFSGIWLKNKEYDVVVLIAGIDPVKSEILLGKNWISVISVFKHYTYFDGTPFGKKE